VLNHVSGYARRTYGNSIWVDSLMMYAVLAAHFGAWYSDRELYEFGVSQHAYFACRLLDDDRGLFQHAFRFRTGKRAPGAGSYWLRGNGWAAASLVEIMEVMDRSHGLWDRYASILSRLLHAAAETQMENGLWDTILNKPGYSFVDSSGASLLAYAILKGIRLGVVDETLAPVAHSVYSAVAGTLKESAGNYVVTRIAGSTNALWQPAYRQMVRLQDNRNFGVGAFLMLAAEEHLYRTSHGKE
jgi:unsaturated rhamnogalacturonyl hydrolase